MEMVETQAAKISVARWDYKPWTENIQQKEETLFVQANNIYANKYEVTLGRGGGGCHMHFAVVRNNDVSFNVGHVRGLGRAILFRNSQ